MFEMIEALFNHEPSIDEIERVECDLDRAYHGVHLARSWVLEGIYYLQFNVRMS